MALIARDVPLGSNPFGSAQLTVRPRLISKLGEFVEMVDDSAARETVSTDTPSRLCVGSARAAELFIFEATDDSFDSEDANSPSGNRWCRDSSLRGVSSPGGWGSEPSSGVLVGGSATGSFGGGDVFCAGAGAGAEGGDGAFGIGVGSCVAIKTKANCC